MSVTPFNSWVVEREIQEICEAAVARLRTRPEDLKSSDIVMTSVGQGDLVELGKETQHRGEPTPKYGIVQMAQGNVVVAKPLAGGPDVRIPANSLYEVDPSEMPHSHVMQMKALGANRLWLKRTERQAKQDERQKAKAAKNREEIALRTPQAPEVSRSDIARIKKILAGGMDTPTAGPTAQAPDDLDPIRKLLSAGLDDKPKGPAPLAGVMRRKGTGVGPSFLDSM